MGTYIATRTRRKQHSLVAYVVKKETFQTKKKYFYILMVIAADGQKRRLEEQSTVYQSGPGCWGRRPLLGNCLLSLIIVGKVAFRSIHNYYSLVRKVAFCSIFNYYSLVIIDYLLLTARSADLKNCVLSIRVVFVLMLRKVALILAPIWCGK